MRPSLPKGTEDQIREHADSLRHLAMLPMRLIQEQLDRIEETLRTLPAEEVKARVLDELERLRGLLGVGDAFPIARYDDLTAHEVVERLGGLTPPQLRKVRDYETRHQARKTILTAVAKRLGVDATT
jgi:hypothetical protein